MRKMLTAIALSSLFAAAPALAAHKHVAKAPVKTAAVSGDEAKTDEKAPADKAAKKPKVKKPKKGEKTEAAPPAETPAK